MKYRVLSLPLLGLFLLLAVFAVAQQPTPFPATGADRRDAFASTSVSGSVRTFDNQPVRDARVELRRIATQSVLASAYTLPNGTFEFTDVPSGNYEIVATVGINEARERVLVDYPVATVQLRMPGPSTEAAAGGETVSVAQFQIPKNARKEYAKAEEAFNKQKYEVAGERVQKALEIFPQYAQALTLRAILHLRNNELEPASADAEHAIKSDSNYGMAYIVLGTTCNLMKRYDDSMRALERGVALAPASWQGHFELAKALLGKGQFQSALRQVDKASALAPANFGLIHLVKAHALLGIKAYDQAVLELEQYLGAEPNGANSVAARQTLGQVRAFLANNQGK